MPSSKKPEEGMTRREMVRRLATAMSAGAAIGAAPGVAAALPAAQPPAGGAGAGQPDNAAASPNWKPAFLDPHQNDTLIVLAERIVPGSADAQVNRFVDLLLSVDTQPAQQRFVNSLSAFDAYSLTTYQAPFKDLTEDQQNEALTVASTAKPGSATPLAARRRQSRGPERERAGGGQEAQFTMRDHFENLKRWVSEAYFSSEQGMKFMGWTGQVMWPSFPGCKHPEGHA